MATPTTGSITANNISGSDCEPVPIYTDFRFLAQNGPWAMFHSTEHMIELIRIFSVELQVDVQTTSDLAGSKSLTPPGKELTHPRKIQEIMRQVGEPASETVDVKKVAFTLTTATSLFELQFYTLFIVLVSQPLRAVLAATSPKPVADKIFLRFNDYISPFLFGNPDTVILGPAELVPRFLFDLRMMYGQDPEPPSR